MIYDIGLGNKILMNDLVETAFQEIDILFNTENTELIGYPRFGMNFDSFLHELTPNEESLRQYVVEQINQNTLYFKQLDYDIQVKYITDKESEPFYTLIITVYINKNQVYKTKIVTIK